MAPAAVLADASPDGDESVIAFDLPGVARGPIEVARDVPTLRREGYPDSRGGW